MEVAFMDMVIFLVLGVWSLIMGSKNKNKLFTYFGTLLLISWFIPFFAII